MTATVCVALRVEDRAVRPALSVRPVRTGMGVRRARAATRAWSGQAPVVMLGVAGAVSRSLQVGDVVVASEVRDEAGGVVACPGAPLFAGALRRAGLVVHVGALLTRDRLGRVDASAYPGVLAVDMESAAVAAGVGSRPFVAVRVISDDATRRPWRPALVRDGWRALRALRRVAAAIDPVVMAAADRDVLLAAPRSFCAGVERAIDIVDRALHRFGPPVYVRRQIVHNAHIVAALQDRGAVFVEELDEVPEGARVIFAAHGVAPSVRVAAERRHMQVIDATCPLVAKVHTEVRRYAAQDHTVLLIGHADHEEVVGTRGEAPEHVIVVEDVATAREIAVPDPRRVGYVMQTTLAVDESTTVADTLRERFPALVGPRTDDICYATSNRQVAVQSLADECDLLLVIGSGNSSNSRRLVEVGERAGLPSYLVEDAAAVDPRWLAGRRRIGVTAGASAPSYLVDELVDSLRGLGSVRVREQPSAPEDVTFTLPKEVC